MAVVIVMTVVTLSSCERVDAGYEGIKVELYGSDRGVNDVSLVTGMVHYNPFTQDVYEYPTFVQTVDYPAFTINANDGPEFTVDPTISLKIVDGKAAIIFKKYRLDVKDIINGPLFNHVKDAFRVQLNKFTADEIVSMRDSLENAVEKQLIATLTRENFKLEQLTSGLKYPSTIVESVNAKAKMVQESQTMQNKRAKVKAEAENKIIAARADSAANAIVAKSITPELLRKMEIEKWNGNVPSVITGGNSQAFFDISKFK
jgi:regulator of protease activity HflC (stomatin/prohibitin superfamily)